MKLEKSLNGIVPALCYNKLFLCPRRNFGWHIEIAPSVRLSVTNRVSAISHKLLKKNLMKLHRKIKHNKKVCRAHDLGSYAQGQGRNQVKGQNLVSAMTQKLLKQILRNFTER